jgi:hypothetical protein
MIHCPSCRRETIIGSQGLPKNFEVLRIRDELKQWTSERLSALRVQNDHVIREKEQKALEAERLAQMAQQEAAQAAQHAKALQQQVAINAREKQKAIEAAESAHARAIQAVVRAEELQNETEILKRQVEYDAMELQQVKSDARSAAAIAADLQSKANALQEQVDRVKSQLLLHSGKHDPTRMVVLVCDPITVGSWLLPYTRYTVICIANENERRLDPILAAKEWIDATKTKQHRSYRHPLWTTPANVHAEMNTGTQHRLVAATTSAVQSSPSAHTTTQEKELSQPTSSSQPTTTTMVTSTKNDVHGQHVNALPQSHSHAVSRQNASVKVYRRYSDFVWLYDILCMNYPGLFVPCLPGKQFFNGHSDFVLERMRSLQVRTLYIYIYISVDMESMSMYDI